MTADYDISQYKNPLFFIDNVIFTVHNDALKVLLVKRADQPFINNWALPGGFVDVELDKNTDATAIRKLKDKTGVTPQYLEQLSTFSGKSRDPRGFSVTLAYYALVPYQEVAAHIASVEDVKWVNVNDVSKLNIAFDHHDIINKANERLKQKSYYSMVPVYCLPCHFTVSQLKMVIETIIGKSIQRKSLVRRIEAASIFETVEKKIKSGGRLAQQYKLIKNADIVNFERNMGSN